MCLSDQSKGIRVEACLTKEVIFDWSKGESYQRRGVSDLIKGMSHQIGGVSNEKR